MIGAGRLHGGLFVMMPFSDTSTCSQVTSSSDHTLWHQRLGHPGLSRFKLFSKCISDMNPFVETRTCEVCPIAKQTHFPFPLSNKKSVAPFDLIHCDI